MRIDTTLLGFDNMNWQRGRRSFVFKGEGMLIVFDAYTYNIYDVVCDNCCIIKCVLYN